MRAKPKKEPRPTTALTGYKHPVNHDEMCENEGCVRQHRGSLYANNTKKGLVWICFHCAKNVDKII